jgi:glycosyltransferase involved in cell wall biosynthesis
MVLFVTIPAYNEEKTIAAVVSSVPRKIEGISEVKIIVFSDGSTDRTIEAAKEAGADYVFAHRFNLGLAQTFKDAVNKALELGADLIVNTDADNQYNQQEISKLIRPILQKQADLVIGDRQVPTLSHMPWKKKYGNLLGSFVIRLLTGIKVTDASSGFRAFTREVAQKINIFSNHTYTHEMIIDTFYKKFRIMDVPVDFNKRDVGQSRLIGKGVGSHIFKSAETIIRTILLYRALQVFSFIGTVFIFGGSFGLARYLYFALILGNTRGHVQSLIISAIMFIFGWNILVLGFIADLIAYNRRLIEEKKF